MKVLVTGGAGYIGSHTVVALREAGYEPIIVDDFRNSEKKVLEGIESLVGQVTCYELDCSRPVLEEVFRREKNIHAAIHFAAFKAVAESQEKPLDYYENNILSTITLLRCLLKYQVPYIVFSSSATVYGEPDTLPVTEESPRKPARSVYGRTKQVCEDIILDTLKSGAALRAILLRYFNPIGAHPSAKIGELPRGIPNNLVPFVTQTAAGWQKELVIFGRDYNTPDGTPIRDYIHVMDLAEAHVAALRYLERGGDKNIMNLGTGKGNSVLEIVKTFEEVCGVKLNYRFGERRPGDVEKIWADATLAEKELGFKAKRTLAEALLDAWKWQKTLTLNQAT
ncbi:MAG: UDP-glucose 4-epimerase GalE [Leptospiraceae bacterium]|nr:UDP-glucose 4-epimerase GalE [Leptospiraceae bacterium]MDW8307040.1 UDP-glucose 4-epimerase GalE [Leptospiraceae bacterium]